MNKDITPKDVDKALQRFFYGRIITALLEAEEQLVKDEEYMAAAKVRDKVNELQEEFNVKIR